MFGEWFRFRLECIERFLSTFQIIGFIRQRRLFDIPCVLDIKVEFEHDYGGRQRQHSHHASRFYILK
jgi:hypothetical protein